MGDLISREELKALLEGDEHFVLVDTLPEVAYHKGHLPGAISIPSEDILVQAPKRIPDRDCDIVVYCGNRPCRRSFLSVERLKSLGYCKVRDYHVGKADWIAAGLRLEAG